jgi:hypothetical protein
MRPIDAAPVLLILASCVFAQSPRQQRTEEDKQNLQTAYCPNIHQLEVAPSQKFFLEGTIGSRHVRVYLDRGGSGVVGLFFDEANWQNTELGGTWMNGQIDASDEAEGHPATGHLKATLAANRLVGSWTRATDEVAEPVDLATIPEPTCDGKESWTRFDDPKSPASFSYPAAWHVEQNRDGIYLTCPDPSEIAYNSNVFVQMGSGKFKSPPELLQCGGKWVYGTDGSPCDCDHPDKLGCHIAKASSAGSATVLDVGEHEWRTYCRDGGYAGQGEGEDRIILLRHSWVEIMADGKSSGLINRLVDSVKERPTKVSK